MLAQVVPGTEYWSVFLAVTITASILGLAGCVTAAAGTNGRAAMIFSAVAVLTGISLSLMTGYFRGGMPASSVAWMGLAIVVTPIVLGALGLIIGFLRRVVEIRDRLT